MTGLINEVIVMANSTSASTAAPVRGRRTRDMADKQARIFEEGDRRLAAWVKENYIDKGKLGVATGEGFYTYA